MNKLATILACAVALTGWQVPMEGARADCPPPQVIKVPPVNMVGTWGGTADAVSKDGYFHNVPVTLVVQDQQTMGPDCDSTYTSSTNTFFRGTITFDPPYGSGRAIPIFSKIESGQPMIVNVNGGTQQALHGMWAGEGFVGCGMGMSMAMATNDPNNKVTMATLAGCMHFTGQEGDTPSMAWLDLSKSLQGQ